MKTEVKYKWMDISSDGLLKEPEDVGAYYESASVNGFDGCFDTKEEAVQRIKELRERYESSRYELTGFILVEKYWFDED